MYHNYFKIKLFLLTFFLCINVFVLRSQTETSFSVDIKWNGIEEIMVYDDTIRRLAFTNAVYDDFMNDTHPLYRCSFPIYSDDVDVSLFVDNLIWSEKIIQDNLDGTQTINERDMSDYALSGPITDNRNGTVTIRMGKYTQEELLKIPINSSPQNHQ